MNIKLTALNTVARTMAIPTAAVKVAANPWRINKGTFSHEYGMHIRKSFYDHFLSEEVSNCEQCPSDAYTEPRKKGDKVWSIFDSKYRVIQADTHCDEHYNKLIAHNNQRAKAKIV